MAVDWEKVRDDVRRELRGEAEITIVQGHEASEGAGTKKTGYALPEMGPFKCGNCIHYADGKCDHKEVIDDPDVPKEDGKAVVKEDACCNFFHPKDKGE